MKNNSYKQHEALIEELFESDMLRGIDPPNYRKTDEASSESTKDAEPISNEVFVLKVNALLQSLIHRYPDTVIYFSDDGNRIDNKYPELEQGLIHCVNNSSPERIIEYSQDTLLRNHSHMSFLFPREKCLINLGWELDVCAYGESEKFNALLEELAQEQGLCVRVMDNIWSDKKRRELYSAQTD